MPVYEGEQVFLQQKHKIELFALIHWESLHWLQVVIKFRQNALTITSDQWT